MVKKEQLDEGKRATQNAEWTYHLAATYSKKTSNRFREGQRLRLLWSNKLDRGLGVSMSSSEGI